MSDCTEYPAFDVIVMNPPYNDGGSTSNTVGNHRHAGRRLHTIFVEKFLTWADHFLVICPAQKWYLGQGSVLKQTIQRTKNLISINIYDAALSEKIFHANTGLTAIFHFGKTYGDDFTRVYYRDEFLYLTPRGADIAIIGNQTAYDIISPLKAYDNILSNRHVELAYGPPSGVIDHWCSNKGTVPIGKTIGKQGDPLTFRYGGDELLQQNSPVYLSHHKKYKMEQNINSWRIGFNQAGSPNKLSATKVIPPGVLTSYAIVTITCADESEAYNLISYLNSKFVKFILAHTHWSRNNSISTFKFIPRIPLDKEFTDSDIYSHFQLSDNHIKHLEASPND